MTLDQQTYDFWALVYHDDETDQWIAHDLRFDIVSFGDSWQHAAAMVEEAVAIAITDDLNAGLNPNDRGPAPDEELALLHELYASGVRILPNDKMNETILGHGKRALIGCYMAIKFEKTSAFNVPRMGMLAMEGHRAIG